MDTKIQKLTEGSDRFQIWERVKKALENEPDLPLAQIEECLSRWDIFLKFRAPSADEWHRVHWHGWRPPWWPLVKHLDLDVNENLEDIPTASIRSLWISSHAEWDPELLKPVPDLVRLDLTGHIIDCGSLPQLLSLEILILQRAVVTATENLARLPRLRHLDLGWTGIGPEALPTLPNLEVLDLAGADLSSLEPLTTFPKLRVLGLRDCKGNPDISPLLNCPHIEEVFAVGAELDVGPLVNTKPNLRVTI